MIAKLSCFAIRSSLANSLIIILNVIVYRAKRNLFADLTGIRDFREICKKKKYMGKFHGKSVDDKQRGFNSRMVDDKTEKCQACSIAIFSFDARKIRPIKWFPGQTSIMHLQ